MKIRVINGPNLNLLGMRQVQLYGSQDYAALVSALYRQAFQLEIALQVMQSNYEGDIVTWIGQCDHYDGLLINPAAYSHTSIAILDALLICDKPKVEVHLTDIKKREHFRQTSLTSQAVDEVIMGQHFKGYLLGLNNLKKLINRRQMAQ